MGLRVNNLNHDLDGNENNEDKAYTGSITELSMNEKMEKLNLEVTVVVTEKLSLKKEFNRIE